MLSLLLFIVCLIFFTRAVMVMTGLLKGPILHSFEKYGDEEDFYYPLVHFLIWLPLMFVSMVILFGEGWLVSAFGSSFVLYCMGSILIGIAYLMYNHVTDLAKTRPDLFLVYPHWYIDLLERTSRGERRRIAYMWLYLPWRARLMYNSNNEAFRIWLDLVLLATIRAEPNSSTGQEHLAYWTYFD